MRIRDHYYSSNNSVDTCLAKLTKPILIVILMFAQIVFAETESTDIENTVVDGIVNEKPVREVDIGAGGNVKPERKYRAKVESLYEWHAHLL